jgi:hypothetical protein
MNLPDFSRLSLDTDVANTPRRLGEPSLTPESIPVKVSEPIDLNAFRGDAAALANFAGVYAG